MKSLHHFLQSHYYHGITPSFVTVTQLSWIIPSFVTVTHLFVTITQIWCDESQNRGTRTSVASSKLKSDRTTRQRPPPQQQQQHRVSSPTPSSSSKSSSPLSAKESPETPRRVTRQSVHELPKSDSQASRPKTSTSGTQHHRSSKHSEHSSPKISRRSQREDESVVPIASRTRRRSQLEVLEISDAPIVKQEPSSDTETDVPSPDLSGPGQVRFIFWKFSKCGFL